LLSNNRLNPDYRRRFRLGGGARVGVDIAPERGSLVRRPAAFTLTGGVSAPQHGRPTIGPMHLLYLHGFRSSPASFKARRMKAWLDAQRPDVTWWCPQLPPSPRAAWTLITQGLQGWPRQPDGSGLAVVGSSLGGFYATAVAESTGCRAMLLNPAVDPARDLARHVGKQTQLHSPEERFFFRPEYITELRALTVPAITRPERYGAVIAKGDELLDWREMTGRYAALPTANLRLLPAGDHALSDFDDHLPFILHFLDLLPPCD
jgi:predicted esterase YcpF (UPF0227 family)